jgi:hypothetical protein
MKSAAELFDSMCLNDSDLNQAFCLGNQSFATRGKGSKIRQFRESDGLGQDDKAKLLAYHRARVENLEDNDKNWVAILEM